MMDNIVPVPQEGPAGLPEEFSRVFPAGFCTVWEDSL